MSVRCLIVDDNLRFLRIARAVLEGDGIAIVGVATTSAEAVQRAAELRPDVMLIDISLGAEFGFDLAHSLAQTGPGPLNMIMISTYPETDFADMVAASPAIGFLSKISLSGSTIQALLTDADAAS